MTRSALLVALASLAALALTGCARPVDVAPGELPPISPDYRASIVAWAKRFYVQPALVRDVSLSDPVLTRDSRGRLLWLVCIEADAPDRDGRYLGPERQAFGFAPNYVSAPLDRRGASLTRQDCDTRPLAYRKWDGFHEAEPRRARIRRVTNGKP